METPFLRAMQRAAATVELAPFVLRAVRMHPDDIASLRRLPPGGQEVTFGGTPVYASERVAPGSFETAYDDATVDRWREEE